MMYGSPFSYGSKQPLPRFSVNDFVDTSYGRGKIHTRRFNGSGWEYGLKIATKNIWLIESSLS